MKTVRTLVLFVLLLSFVVGALSVLSMGEGVGEAFGAINPSALIAVIGLASLNYALRYVRWHLYFRFLGQPVPWLHELIAYIAGFAFTATPGKAGEAGRSLLLRPLGVPHSRTVGACIAERINDLAVVALLAGLAIALQIEYSIAILVGAVLLLGIFIVVRQEGMKDWAISLLKKWGGRFTTRLGSALDRSYGDIVALLTGRMFFLGLGFGIVGWLCEGLGFWYLLNSTGYSMPWHLATGIYMLSLLIGALSFLPGGLIGTELSLFALLVAQGVPQPIAASVTLFVRICTLGYSISLGGLALLLSSLRNRFSTPPVQPDRRTQT